jgi:hypothetical protein
MVTLARIAAACVMKDYRASLEKLRRDAAEAALIRDLATDKTKREFFDRLHQHFNQLADEVEKAMLASKSAASGPS